MSSSTAVTWYSVSLQAQSPLLRKPFNLLLTTELLPLVILPVFFLPFAACFVFLPIAIAAPAIHVSAFLMSAQTKGGEGKSFFQAVRENDIKAVQEQLSKAPTLIKGHEDTSKRKTALMIAASKGHTELVNYLLAKGASVTDKTIDLRYSALHFAASNNRVDAMRALIAAKANIEELGVGDWRPLHTAASSGCLGAVEVLIENGAQVNARASDGTTPLIKAATNKRRQVCSYLIQHGADANIVGDMKLSALMHAARVGDLELTQILVEEGNANVTAVDHAGNTALDIAEQHNMSEVAIYLWHRGADSAALRSASVVGKMRWARPRVLDAPTGRYGAATAVVGSTVYMFGGTGFPAGVICSAPESSITDSNLYTNQLADLYKIDFDKAFSSNVMEPTTSMRSNRSLVWNPKAGDGLLVHPDGLTIESHQTSDCHPALVKSEAPYRESDGFAYFELTIIATGPRRLISVGFVDEAYPVNKKHPGWVKDSYGFHGDDGSIFHNSGAGRFYSDRFEAGDVIGCGLNFKTSEVFFVVNGVYQGLAYQGVKGTEFYASVGFRNPGAKIKANFGYVPFRFDFHVPTVRWSEVELKAYESDDGTKAMMPRSQSYSKFFKIPGSNKFFLLPELKYSYNHIAWIFDAEKEEWHDVQLTGVAVYHLQGGVSVTALGNKFMLQIVNMETYECCELVPRFQSEDAYWIERQAVLGDLMYYINDKYLAATITTVGDNICFIVNDRLLMWDPETMRMSDRPVAGSRPSIRLYSSTPIGNSVVTFGGWDSRTQVNDMYILDTDSPSWFKPHHSGTVPNGRNYQSAGYVIGTNGHIIGEAEEDNIVPAETLGPTKSRQFRFVFQMHGWNGRNCVTDFDILSMENLNDEDELGSFMDADNSAADVTLEVYQPDSSLPQKLSLHKVILSSRSSYFRKILLEQKNNSVIQITTDYKLVCALIKYLYSDAVDFMLIGSLYREFVGLASTFAPEHAGRLAEEHLLSRVTTPSTLGQDMHFGFRNEAFSDIRLIVEGNPIPAHKVVICARSAYFRAMLMGNLKESRQDSIELQSASLETFLPVLEFLYTKRVDLEKIGDIIVEVFLLACEYQVRKLKAVLEDVIAYNISSENVVSLLMTAVQQDAVTLKHRCIAFINANLPEVAGTEDYIANVDAISSLLV